MFNYISKIILLLIIFTSGCDLLTTREAEKPINARSSYVVATTVDQLFENLKNSFLEKIETDYMSCFVDNSFTNIPYVFTPSSESSYKYTVLLEWSLDNERTYFKNLINAIGDNSIFIELKLISSSVESNAEIRNYDYTITIPFIYESISTIYKGNAQFKVILDSNNEYVISEWFDTGIGDAPSWSELKGKFYIF